MRPAGHLASAQRTTYSCRSVDRPSTGTGAGRGAAQGRADSFWTRTGSALRRGDPPEFSGAALSETDRHLLLGELPSGGVSVRAHCGLLAGLAEGRPSRRIVVINAELAHRPSAAGSAGRRPVHCAARASRRRTARHRPPLVNVGSRPESTQITGGIGERVHLLQGAHRWQNVNPATQPPRPLPRPIATRPAPLPCMSFDRLRKRFAVHRSQAVTRLARSRQEQRSPHVRLAACRTAYLGQVFRVGLASSTSISGENVWADLPTLFAVSQSTSACGWVPGLTVRRC